MKKLVVMLSLFAFAAQAEPRKDFQLSYGDAEEAIGWALAQKGAGEKVAASIDGRKNDAVFSASKPISVDIRGIQFDKKSGRWSASLLFVSQGEVLSALPASGHFEELVEVAVLRRTLRSGEVISAQDIEIQDYHIERTRSDTITDLASLIGKTPLRGITSGRPIRMSEIAQPAVLKKNALVQMRYNSPGMEITTTGQAMTDGSRGELIEVKNLTSKAVVHAVVENERGVLISPPGDQLAGAPYVAN